jgi:hypothetical protein
MAWKLSAGLVLLMAGGGLAAWYALQTSSSSDQPRFGGFPIALPSESHFTGTASCSGRACHGSLEPSSDRSSIHGNEHTTWQVHDRHAEAYRVLFDKPSEHMAQALKLPTPAHESARCLACHVDPAIIAENLDLARTELAAGVGCETCHGSAAKWLGPHTGWGRLSAEQKKERYSALGMVDLSGPREKAELCVRCHVGSWPNQVDHDLVAAGHPRLEFDLPGFLANMPPHWRDKKQETDNAADTWAVGQLVSARSALQLLAQRADPEKAGTWPEFAEYDCFACHHDLGDSNWRRKPEHFGKHSPGLPSWSQRYLMFLPELLNGKADSPLAVLNRVLAQPLPDRKQVGDLCNQLERVFAAHETKQFQALDRKRVLQSLAERPDRFVESWDAAAQACLAADALGRSLDHAETDTAVRELGRLLAFPRGADSPARFRATADLDEQLKNAIRRAGQAALQEPKP